MDTIERSVDARTRIIKYAMTVSMLFSLSVFIAGGVCSNGDPFLISHASAYRLEGDETKLRTAIDAIADISLREKVRDAFLGRICVNDEDLLTALLVMLDSSDPVIRAETILVLMHFDAQSAYAAERNALRDPSPRVRLMALGAVVNTCDDNAVGQINELRRHDPDPGVRKEAKSISKIFKNGCVKPMCVTKDCK
jgi:HEAT repeat protein